MRTYIPVDRTVIINIYNKSKRKILFWHGDFFSPQNLFFEFFILIPARTTHCMNTLTCNRWAEKKQYKFKIILIFSICLQFFENLFSLYFEFIFSLFSIHFQLFSILFTLLRICFQFLSNYCCSSTALSPPLSVLYESVPYVPTASDTSIFSLNPVTMIEALPWGVMWKGIISSQIPTEHWPNESPEIKK